ncbi:MAG: thiamine phosphate synthase [Oscillospiraceae bacterium]|jgi:thiamine-phosphate pyrophosphorylase|nr:thiamine phosphate synthase [Oscillospiraceae bacterium]
MRKAECGVQNYPEIAVTNRHICAGDFLAQIEKIAARRPWAILLREKDLPPEEYASLARKASECCAGYGVPLIAHTHPAEACGRLHVPFAQCSSALARQYRLSVSVHSLDEARQAAEFGADFLIAGHIFPTDCKPGVPARGLDFLRDLCAGVSVPVFAIGGITGETAPLCLAAGAAGICRMSYWMTQ